MCLVVNKKATKEFFKKHPNKNQVLRSWKVVNTGSLVSEFCYHQWKVGENKAIGYLMKSKNFCDRDMVDSGAFHAYTSLKEAKFWLNNSKSTICVTFQVKDVVAIGYHNEICFTKCKLGVKSYRKATKPETKKVK